MNIPFVDLKAQYLSIKVDIDRAIAEILDNTAFVGGGPVKDFEKKYADYMSVKNCISCANGTDSIEILLQAFGIGKGDEVIVPAISWISTSEAVSTAGATPVFVDIHPDYYTIDVKKIEEKITSKTRAIIPVHLYGLPAEMDEIMSLAKKYNLLVIEDCAQSHDAAYKGKKVGTIGHAASFSFYPGKNLGAYGDAGCMITNNDEVAYKCRMIANHGQLEKHNHIMEGRNSRLDSLQAAILNVKLPHLKTWTAARSNNAKIYSEYLQNSEIKIPSAPEYSGHVYHLYVIQVNDRDEVQKRLKEAGIETAIHYPTPLPFLKAYKHRGFAEKDFPVANFVKDRVLSLPMYPELNVEMIKEISNTLAKEKV